MSMNYKPDNSFTKRYSELLTAFGLSQNVNRSTHLKGHILDHIISRDADSFQLSDIRIGDFVSDHSLVHTSISLQKPEIEREELCYRKKGYRRGIFSRRY